MRVVLLSDHETAGGAAVAASRLAQALVRTGIEIIRVVRRSDHKEFPWVIQALRQSWQEQGTLKALGKASKRLSMFVAGQITARKLGRLFKTLQPDVINIHNLHAAFWEPGLAAICVGYAPTVWTLHDMWSFTGRCVYSYDCRKFITGCDASCPTATEYPMLKPGLIAGAWEQRRRLLTAHTELIAVCPSRWLAQEARSGLWFKHRVDVIPNGLPLDIYTPLDRVLARTALGIKPCEPVVLVAADKLAARQKGGTILIEALQRVYQRPLTLVTLGHGCLPRVADGITLHSLGYIDHERTKVLAYAAADVLVHPALADNLPNVVMEAMACGTPCVGFAIGGVPDMVRPGKTGWLAHQVTAQALASALDTALKDIQQGEDLRVSCRSIAEAEYDEALQAQRYLALFNQLQQKSIIGPWAWKRPTPNPD